MPFFADEDDSRQDVFSLLRRVFACSDPLSWPFQRWIRAELVGSSATASIAPPALTQEAATSVGTLSMPALVGVPVQVSTPGPVPAAGVQLSRTYTTALPAGYDATLIFYDETLLSWVAVPSQLS